MYRLCEKGKALDIKMSVETLLNCGFIFYAYFLASSLICPKLPCLVVVMRYVFLYKDDVIKNVRRTTDFYSYLCGQTGVG